MAKVLPLLKKRTNLQPKPDADPLPADRDLPAQDLQSGQSSSQALFQDQPETAVQAIPPALPPCSVDTVIHPDVANHFRQLLEHSPQMTPDATPHPEMAELLDQTAWPDVQPAQPARRPSTVPLIYVVRGIAIAFWTLLLWYVMQPAPRVVQRLDSGFNRATQAGIGLVNPSGPQTGPQIGPQGRHPAAPAGWRTVALSNGVTAFVAPLNKTATFTPSSNSGGAALDGTRYPYVADLSLQDLLSHPIGAGRYLWRDTWQGEGYGRELDAAGQLVSPREGGADIHLTITLDKTADKTPDKTLNHSRPNVIITVQSDQAQTAQTTALSAFQFDAQGQTLARKDFEQLPPFYDITLMRGDEVSDTKSLSPLGTVTFAYYVPLSELHSSFPIHLQAVNQQFNERLQQIQALESQGWVVKEVPPPS